MNHSVASLASTVWCRHHLRRARERLRHPSVALRAATRVPCSRHSASRVYGFACAGHGVSAEPPRVGLCDGLLPPSPVQAAAGVRAEIVHGLDGAGRLVHASAELLRTRACRCLSPCFTSFEHVPQSGIAGPDGNSVARWLSRRFCIWPLGESAEWSSSVAAPRYNPAGGEAGAHVSHPHRRGRLRFCLASSPRPRLWV